MKLSSKVYDFLKKCLTIYIPALITLFVTIVGIWDLNVPVDAIVATITAITTCLGVILGISSNNYYKDKENV